MSRSAIALGFVLAVIAAGVGGYGYGHSEGKASQVADYNAKAVKQLGDQLSTHDDLVKRSTAANQALRATIQLRKKANQQTSEVLTHELNSTADSRAGCVFPPGVMRELSAARDRAAEAASGGVSSAVPGATSGSTGR
ncbi:hypothetical protein G7047_18925 [Diaphorobacter sp. HDW4A]|uniref:hypothetical protein n=1 Tax=Diaphorobacter sp. HDW4A TaxID=2714924 RepID=UPI0014079602|nr:hypothetical protein [Diaphorobacter sp. HDW4A]QIL81758.1 hypothetical protein G7047_18925 [Diaphorobacter sp. HDW4A]